MADSAHDQVDLALARELLNDARTRRFPPTDGTITGQAREAAGHLALSLLNGGLTDDELKHLIDWLDAWRRHRAGHRIAGKSPQSCWCETASGTCPVSRKS